MNARESVTGCPSTAVAKRVVMLALAQHRRQDIIWWTRATKETKNDRSDTVKSRPKFP